MNKMTVGVIGCGMISEIYLQNITNRFSDVLQVIGCADLNPEASARRAEQFGIKAMTVEELLSSDEIEIVLNLTIPATHYEISKKALLAGKHAYSEKPLAIRLKDAQELVALAKERGLQVAAAPDTFLGGGIQTCLKLLEEGAIGKPISAQGLLIARGPEGFHPNPEFFYQPGAGPIMDMGPYYFTALFAMFGKARRVAAMGKSSFAEKTVMNPNSPKHGESFPINVESFMSTTVEFENGVIASLTTAWDMSYPYWRSGMPLLTVFGSEGTLCIPDPNTFGGYGENGPMGTAENYVKLRRGAGEFENIPIRYDFVENSRGLGLADFAGRINCGKTPRVSGEGSLHVLEMMLGANQSAREGIFYTMTTDAQRPEPMYEDVPGVGQNG